MKFIILAVALMALKSAQAATYYFCNASGSDNYSRVQAQNPLTPWKTLNKLNAIGYLNPGDSFLLKRGETFYGSIPGYSGSIGKEIFYGSYGIGANPVISGFSNMSNWTLLSGNIYYTSLDVPNLNMVIVDGLVKGMGRYPNTGYLNYQSHRANQSITDNKLQSSPSWVGAEVVIRKYRWILDRHVVTSHSGGTLNYNALATYGNNNTYSPVDGNGYFIQGHLSTLDQDGEWYYDNTAKRLYMYFGGGTPAGKTVKASTINKLAFAGSFVSFNNIDFEGGDYALVIQGASNITANNINFKQQSSSAIYALTANNVAINGGSISDALNNGFYGEWDVNNVNINGVAVTNCGVIAGAGSSGDGSYSGINVNGNGNTITNNVVTNSGYNGIAFTGNNILVEKNLVDKFCAVKDDGGGIYTVISSNGVTASNRVIRNNIVLNAIGAYAGCEAYSYEPYGKAAGIYLDDYTNNVSVTGNTVAHGPWSGLFHNGGTDNTIANNLVYDFSQQLSLQAYTGRTVRNLMITGNQLVARTASQKTMSMQLWLDESPALWGMFNNNFYARPVDDTATITVDRQYNGGLATNISLATWKSTYNQDAASNKSPVAITSNPDQNIRFEYNSTNVVKTIVLNGTYTDVKSKTYNGIVTLTPYTSVVIVKTGEIRKPPTAFAGPNQTITLPTSVVSLFGSGVSSTGIITNLLWTKVAGPSMGSITNPNSPATSVTALVKGIYQFEITATDNEGATAKDTVSITVNSANLPPVATAGNDQYITLPVSFINLAGSGTVADGTISSYLWTKIAGPSAGTITDANAATTSVTGLVKGIYQFELTVTDSQGAIGKAHTQITVGASALPVNILNFYGEANGRNNILNWNTATEQNNTGFEVQHSTNTNNFTKISFQVTKALDGNCSTHLSYNFIDKNCNNGTNYYRLKQIDKDGKYSYSNVVELKNIFPLVPELVTLYPNPAASVLNIKFAPSDKNKVFLSIVDINGKTIINNAADTGFGESIIQINIANLPSGSYFLKCISNGGNERTIKKFEKK
jgi:hypothetical protein